MTVLKCEQMINDRKIQEFTYLEQIFNICIPFSFIRKSRLYLANILFTKTIKGYTITYLKQIRARL